LVNLTGQPAILRFVDDMLPRGILAVAKPDGGLDEVFKHRARKPGIRSATLFRLIAEIMSVMPDFEKQDWKDSPGES